MIFFLLGTLFLIALTYGAWYQSEGNKKHIAIGLGVVTWGCFAVAMVSN